MQQMYYIKKGTSDTITPTTKSAIIAKGHDPIKVR